MIFCTAGHVDHGKTALVRALTGVDTDRLAEERRRGLTIELGFAPLELPGVGRVSLVDVPGHAQFIPTMLSGCGGLDGALFTVAADEGPMPQTAEHLDILSLLGLERGVVALTRADLASPAARAEVEARTRALTAGTFLEGAPRIFVSAVTGEGLEALRAALAAMARQAPPPPEGSPRLHVDRVFSVDGSGTVVTGTLTGGPLRRGDRVQLYPGGQTARVRGLQCHGVPAEALPAGVRAAVNLAGVRLRDVGRGDTLAAPGALALTDRTDVSLRVLPDAPFPVHTGSQLHFHHGARALVCRCILLGQDVLRPGEAGWAQLRFTQPAAAAPGDRFVARFFSPLATVGGGVLVDLAHIKSLPKHKICIITTGSQGETMSALTRMAFNTHRQVEIQAGDRVILSASAIPGNENAIGSVINELYRKDAEVVNERLGALHVSGHACQEELKIIHALVKPKFFIPVHGEQRHLKTHAKLAQQMGMPPKNILISDIGKVIELTPNSAKINGTVPAGRVFVDGYGVGDVGSVVLRDRKHLAEDGMIVVVVSMSGEDGSVVSGPDIITRGFVYVKESEGLMEELRKVAVKALEECRMDTMNDWASIKSEIKNAISGFLYKKTKRNPMILPVIMEV